jgi:predicted transcriptional regulator
MEALRRLTRMARVLASPLRMKIMVALGVRPMSPRMIQEWLEDDAYEIFTINKNLRQLKQSGWVELAGIKAPGASKGSTEYVYRAVQLPIFDDVTWRALPLAMRGMVSWKIFETLLKRLTEAWSARTFDARADRHFSCTSSFVDQLGWDRIVALVDDFFFDFLLGELESASLRLAGSGEEPIPVMVALAFFESPSGRPTPDRCEDLLVDASAALSQYAFALRMAKVIADPLRLMILDELSTREMSAKMFLDEFGGRKLDELGGEKITKGEVYRAFRALKEYDWLVLVETRPREEGPGGREHFYRAIRPPVLAEATWPVLPASVKDEPTGKIFEAWVNSMGSAMKAGTMDIRVERHFTWTPGLLDGLGWIRVIEGIARLLKFVEEELNDARVRLEDSGEQPIPVTAALAAIESIGIPMWAD